MKTPTLETDRLILRPFCMEDAQEVFECWESDPEVAKYMFWTSHNDINKTVNWVKKELSKIDSDDWYRWAILSKETGNLLGTGLIYVEEEYGKFEMAYNFGKKAWGFGYTTEAMQEVIKVAKEELGIKEIMGRHAKENHISGKILKKLGFAYIKDIPYECNRGGNIYEGKEYILKL
ncbi:GNAT family N-acetyltransferase [Clostridium estertheticum]|uniref:GNAT family N-acetyltransferase n=1 Tax=Clostridium estertheticum TaxID=238834 RepID=UPI001CF2D5A4|nr:GNAT family N-acetyltransferase [Clostridium estertheticum]MCB2357185.1 GNAT family N-acetyltransferase [Clostridium estertheticum]WAG43872.1 GNAT family N-acetyltransferase [Clostridium estertheticum]